MTPIFCFPGSYPQQAVYPPQSTAPVYPPAMQMSPQAPPYTDTPPAYSEVTLASTYTPIHPCNSPHSNLCSCLQIYQPRYVLPPQVPGQLPQMSSPYPGAQVYMPMQPHMSVGPVGQNVPMAYYPMGAVYPPGSTVMVDGGFDAGARFTAGSSVNIPVSIQPGTTTHTHTHFHLLKSN